MTADVLTRWLADGQPITVVDVRSAFEFRRGHVPGAVHVPFWRVALEPRIAANPSTPLVVYCGHGPRAWMALTALRWRGVTHACLLQGHMAGWRGAGRPEAR